MKLLKHINLLFFVALAMLSAPVFSDRNQSISVNADYAERNEITGVTEYRGNVVIRQGTTLINADRVVIYYQNGKVSRISCAGAPASYQQTSAIDGILMVARAEVIEYLVFENMINLKSNASLTRNGTSIKGDTINYDLAQGTWKAKGDEEGEQKRIQLVIPPFNQTINNEDLAIEKEVLPVKLKDIN